MNYNTMKMYSNSKLTQVTLEMLNEQTICIRKGIETRDCEFI